MKKVYSYKNFIKIYTYDLKANNKRVKNFHFIKLADAAVLVLQNHKTKKILLVKEYRAANKKRMMGLPGGLMDDKETPKKTLRREIFEELNLKLKKVDYIGRSINNGNYHCGTNYVYFSSTSQEVFKTEKNISYKWVSLKELKTKILKKNLINNSGFFAAISLYIFKCL